MWRRGPGAWIPAQPYWRGEVGSMYEPREDLWALKRSRWYLGPCGDEAGGNVDGSKEQQWCCFWVDLEQRRGNRICLKAGLATTIWNDRKLDSDNALPPMTTHLRELLFHHYPAHHIMTSQPSKAKALLLPADRSGVRLVSYNIK